MTTQELKNKIEKVLGNSIRCLLPSYWWKRIFGLLVDEIDDVRSTANSKANKSEVASLSNSVNTLSDKVDNIDSGNKITVDSELSYESTNPVQNKVVADTLRGYVLFPLGNAKEFITSYFSDEKPRERGLIWSVNSYTGNNYSEVIGLKYWNNQYAVYFTLNGSVWRWIYDGTTYDYIREEEVFKPDTFMSDTSTNPVQNKVIKAYVDTEVAKKVDKVSGKGLSTEDFTTLLKTKLEGLENYDDTTITNAISSLETRFNTLVSGDTSAAIESFNEVVAFLENLTDTQDLSSIIASIEQQINATRVELQNVVDEVIENEEVTSKGLNSLNQKIAQAINDRKINYATKAELNSEVEVINKEALDNEEVTSVALNYLNQRIDKLKNDLLINYAKGATLRAEIEAIMTIISDDEKVISTSLNDLNERIEFTNNRFVNYALKEELSSEVSRIEQIILTNEKVISTSLNDLNERIEQVSNLIKSSLATN